MDYKYVSIDRIFSKVTRDFSGDFSERDVIEWCGEALEFIGAIKSYQEFVCFREVSNHQCEVPKGLHAIIQIGRNNRWTPQDRNCITPSIVAANVDICNITKSHDPCMCPPDDAVWLDCNGTPIVAYDLAYYRPFFDLQGEYFNWCNSGYCNDSFTPVRLKTSSFFNSLVCTNQQDNNSPYHPSRDEYTLIDKAILRFSFKEGFVAIACTKQALDKETGYPMIPDNISFTTAITKYIGMMIEGKVNYGSPKYRQLAQDWDWYCGQSSNVDKMPYGIDEYQNLLDQRSYRLPSYNSYYGFFGNLGTAENPVNDYRSRDINDNRPFING